MRGHRHKEVCTLYLLNERWVCTVAAVRIPLSQKVWVPSSWWIDQYGRYGLRMINIDLPMVVVSDGHHTFVCDCDIIGDETPPLRHPGDKVINKDDKHNTFSNLHLFPVLCGKRLPPITPSVTVELPTTKTSFE